jgi:hypothetical protein
MAFRRLDQDFRYRGVRLEVEGHALSVPFPVDPVLASFQLNRDERARYQEFCSLVMDSRSAPRKTLPGASVPGEHEVGGYTIYIQGYDLRLLAELRTAGGLYPPGTIREWHIDTPSNFAWRTKIGAAMQDWQQLFLVDSEGSAKIEWGDFGKLYFLIRKDDLQRRAFEESWMEYDDC